MIEYKGELYDCDTEAEAEALYQLALNPPALSAEEIAEDELMRLRMQRDELLAETDWWASSDLTMTPEQSAYRQALRDITETYSSLAEVVWPEKP